MADGYVRIPRQVWFMDGVTASEPCTRREAFVDLFFLGDRPSSIRFLAKRWRWHRRKTERFLKRLEREGKIECRQVLGGPKTGLQITVQPGTVSGTVSGTLKSLKPQGLTEPPGTVSGTVSGTKVSTSYVVPVSSLRSDTATTPEVSSNSPDSTISEMLRIWSEVFGRRRLKLTKERHTKLALMVEEQLEPSGKNVLELWRQICEVVRADEFLMTKPLYHQPESFLRNEERRERYTHLVLDQRELRPWEQPLPERLKKSGRNYDLRRALRLQAEAALREGKGTPEA